MTPAAVRAYIVAELARRPGAGRMWAAIVAAIPLPINNAEPPPPEPETNHAALSTTADAVQTGPEPDRE